jgi:hypothetical protein
VGDNELKSFMWGYSVQNTFQQSRLIAAELIRVIRHRPGEKDQNQPNHPSPPLFALTDLQKSFLKNIGNFPEMNVVERYEYLNLTRYMGDKIKAELLGQGLITQNDATTPQGKVSLLELTEKGRKSLPGGYFPKPALHGGAEHEYWKHKIAKCLEKKGWNVRIEAGVSGMQFDILIERKNIQRAIEVETGKGDIRRTIAKLQNATLDLAIIAAVNRNTEQRIAQELSRLDNSMRNKVILTLASKLVD